MLSRISLLTKVMISVSLVVSILSIVFASTSIVVLGAQRLEQQQQRADLIVALVAGQLAKHLWDYDSEGARRLLEQVAQDADFQSVALDSQNADQAVLLGGDETQVLPVTVAQTEIVYKDESTSKVVGKITLKLSQRSVDQERQQLIMGVAIACGIMLVCTLITLRIAFVFIERPLRRMTGLMGTLAAGAQNLRIPYQSRPDEIGAIARALSVFKENAEARTRLEQQRDAEQAQVQIDRAALLNSIADSFETTVAKIVDEVLLALRELQSVGSQLQIVADQTGDYVTTVAQASEEASRRIMPIASSIGQFAESISAIAAQTDEAHRLSASAQIEVNKSNHDVEGLTEAANRIATIVSLIGNIAGQTNLLALNASIEASRAGDAGRGFAVVANEVKALASQTGAATQDIAHQVQSLQGATSTAVENIRSIGQIVSNISGLSTKIASEIARQNDVTQVIAQNVDHVAIGARNISDSNNKASVIAENMNLTSLSVRSSTEKLSSHAENLRVEVGQFLLRVRSA